MNPKKKVGFVIVFSNFFLLLSKGIVWWYSGSIAVQSEAFNSLVDFVYSLIIISGFLLSRREKTSEYPEGLIRLEPLVSLFVSGAIVITGGLIMYNGVQRLLFDQVVTTRPNLAVGVLVVGSLIKLVLYRYISTEADKHNSPSLAATAVDTRNDILTALIAVVGVLGYRFGVPDLEPISAILVSGYIVYSGVKVGEENIEYALGRSVPDEIYTKITEQALTNPDVEGIHDVEIHYTGPILDISMHIEIEGGKTIEEGHQIETTVADRIRDVVDEGINEINIHLDPDSLDEWKELDD